MNQRRAVTVVGIGDDGCVGLSSRAMGAIARAQVLVGGERHLAFFPQHEGERITLKGGLSSVLGRVAELAEDRNVCVLASGDPLFFGVGSSVVQAVGAEHVDIIPQPTSVQLAFARAGLKWEDAAFISVHGRPLQGLATRLRTCSKVALLTDATNSPAAIAAHLRSYGLAGWNAWVCENLGGPSERVRQFTLEDLAQLTDCAPLNVLLLTRTDANWRSPPVVPFLHEDAFAKRIPKKGLITKREVRVLSLAALQLRVDSVVWDIGAGSGSVSIEAAMLAREGRVYAIEVDPVGANICQENALTHGTDNVTVLNARAPEALLNLETPDAIFVGGSKGSMAAIVELCLERMRPGGRLVVNAVTLENAHEAYAAFRKHSIVPDVTLLQVSRAEPLAHYMRFEALNPIQIFAGTKPDPSAVDAAEIAVSEGVTQ